jgi:hypothetical protein
MGHHSDDEVGKPAMRDDGRQSAEQRRILGAGGEDGRPEPRPTTTHASQEVRSPPVRGGSSQGTGDRVAPGGGGADEVGVRTGERPQPEPGQG